MKTNKFGSISTYQLSRQIFTKNRHIAMLMLITNLIYKIVMIIYRWRKQAAMNGKYRYLPKDLWRNQYPIVLVHGFAGSAEDQSYLMGNYFEYAVKSS